MGSVEQMRSRTTSLSLWRAVCVLGAVAITGCQDAIQPGLTPSRDVVVPTATVGASAPAVSQPTAVVPSQTPDVDLAPSRVTTAAGGSSTRDPDWNESLAFAISALAPENAPPSPTTQAATPATGALGPALPPVTPVPGGVRVMISEKTFRPEGREKALRVSFDDIDLLKVLNMEPVTPECEPLMPSWLKDLHGKQVRIRGYMYPTFEPTGLQEFVLARDNQICCFVNVPRIYDVLAVRLKAGKTTDYIPPTRAFDVIGRFRIELVVDRGELLGLYWIDDAVLVDR